MLTGEQSKICILQWCYVLDFLQYFYTEFHKNLSIELNQFYIKWTEKNKIEVKDCLPFANTLGFYLGGLFVLVALQKEAFYEKIKMKIEDCKPSEWGKVKIDIFKEKELNHFIRHIRNSLTHNRFTCENNNLIEFYDVKNGKRNFQVRYSGEELAKFTLRFARMVMFEIN